MNTELYEEHFKYELSMAGWALWCQKNSIYQDEKYRQVFWNIGHEAFYVHARNVISFLKEHINYIPSERTSTVMKLAERQVFTLTKKRTSVQSEKIQQIDSEYILEELEKAAEQLVS